MKNLKLKDVYDLKTHEFNEAFHTLDNYDLAVAGNYSYELLTEEQINKLTGEEEIYFDCKVFDAENCGSSYLDYEFYIVVKK